ncbi:TonB-dependent receptor family protein [Halomonas llamarensis]|uniref:TonB-dependent receptor n=1 Tax=Halomonas llamarensis TaxID=2945104 RepID=A0ABT0SLM3_9GAMM|nr:TonB-dependent receptor [Halomonas llamarensis]MCL7928703.1 TonB-dependent receptor [Halomonas llamarensis]
MRHLPLLVAIAAAMPALSQANEPVRLPAIDVSAEAEKAPLQPSVSQEQKRLERVPGGTNLTEPQQETRLATLRDALDYQPGVVIQEFFGGFDTPRLNVRGSGIQSNPVNRGVLLLQDGLPLNEADGSFVIGVLEPRDTALVSIRRGANAITPSATTLGGELDFQSLTGADEAGRVRLETGSFGRQGWQAAVGGQGESLDGRFSVSGNRYDGFRNHSESERDSLRANLGFYTDDFENRSYFSWTDLAFDIPFVVPKQRLEDDPEGVLGDKATPLDNLFNVYRRDPLRETKQWRLANRSRWGDETLRQDLGFYVQNTDDRFKSPVASTETDSRTFGGQWQLNGQWTGPLSWRLGLAWSRSDMDRTLNAVNPQNGSNATRFGDFDLHAENRHVLAGLDWQLAEDWVVTGDIKWGQAIRDADDRQNGETLDQSWTYATPKLGVNWTPAPDLRWYANISRSQEAPTYWEIIASNLTPTSDPNNPPNAELVELDLQRATTTELGGQGALSEALYWNLAVYHSRVEDELMATTNDSGTASGTFNYAGKTRHQGVEAGLSGSLPVAGAAIDYRSSWTYSDFRFDGGEFDDNRIGGVPRHLVNAEVLYRINSWRVGPNVRWMPVDTPVDHVNTDSADQEAYTLLGFKIDYEAGPWRGYLQGDNLTDEVYASSYVIRKKQPNPNAPTYLPGNGRSVSAGISYRF